MSTIISDISEAMQHGKSKLVKQLVPQALEEGIPAQTILEEGLLSGMNIVGQKFKNNEVFVPEVLVAARAMNAGTELLKPYLMESGVESKGKVAIGTVKGDLHDIGKNLVRMMMEGKGLKVVDLGTDVDPERFVSAAREEKADIIAVSALLTTTMTGMRDVVDAVNASDLKGKVKIMVGGAPVTQAYADTIGADGYTADAASAAEAALAFCVNK